MAALYDLKRHKCSFLRVKMKYEKPYQIVCGKEKEQCLSDTKKLIDEYCKR